MQWQEDVPRTLQYSSILKSPLLSVMESSSGTPACRHGRQAALGQHSTTTLLVATATAECLLPGHVALLGLAVNEVVEGEASKSHSKSKMLCYRLSNARCPNVEYQSRCSLCVHDTPPKRRLHSPLCNSSSLTVPLHNSVPLHDVLVLTHKEMHTQTQQLASAWQLGEVPWMEQSHGTNCGDLSSRGRVVPRDERGGF